MKIEEVIKLYEFLAESTRYGILTIWFIINALGIGSVYFMGKDKNLAKIKWWFPAASVFVIVIVSVGLYGLKKEANDRRNLLKLANCIKSEYVMYGFKETDDDDIINNFHCKKCMGTDSFTRKDLKKLLNKHPTEFLRIMTDDGPQGIRIIDPDAITIIDKYNVVHLPFMKSKILEYMRVPEHADSLTYQQVRDNIDDYFDDEWIELMLSKYDSIFIPYGKTIDKVKYAKTHGLKLTLRQKKLMGRTREGKKDLKRSRT